MSAIAYCSCPEPLPAAHRVGGRLMRCSGCRQLRKPPPTPKQRRWGLWLAAAALSLLIPGAAVIVAVKITERKFKLAMEEYAERPVPSISPAQDEPRIRKIIQDSHAAVRDRLGGAFTKCFSVRRALAELESRGAEGLILRRSDEELWAGQLEEAIGKLCLDLSQKEWRGLIHDAVKFNAAKGEAEVTCLIKAKEPRIYAHLRFWLIKEADGWGIYDFEDLDNRNRWCSIMGRAAQSGNGTRLVQRLGESTALLRQAQALAGEGKTEEALALMQKARAAAKETPVEPLATRYVADLLAELGRADEALQVLDELLKARKGMPGALVGKAFVYDRQGKKQEALAHFEEALAVLGEDPGLRISIGRLKDALERPAEAKEAYQLAATLVREDPDLGFDLGVLLLRRGSRKESGPVFLAVAGAGPDYFFRAAQMLKEARAEAELEALLATDKKDILTPGALSLFRGALLRWKGRLDEAEKVLRKAMLESESESTTLYMEELSLALAGLKRTDEALKLAAQLATAEGWGPKGRLLKACALAATHPDDALKDALAALRENSTLVITADNEALLAPLRAIAEFKKLTDELRPRVRFDTK